MEKRFWGYPGFNMPIIEFPEKEKGADIEVTLI